MSKCRWIIFPFLSQLQGVSTSPASPFSIFSLMLFFFSFVCTCEEGWTGKTCEDSCTGADCAVEGQCLHGGTLGDLSGTCYCPEPWIGARCQEYDYCTIAAKDNGGLACEHDVCCSPFCLTCKGHE